MTVITSSTDNNKLSCFSSVSETTEALRGQGAPPSPIDDSMRRLPRRTRSHEKSRSLLSK